MALMLPCWFVCHGLLVRSEKKASREEKASSGLFSKTCLYGNHDKKVRCDANIALMKEIQVRRTTHCICRIPCATHSDFWKVFMYQQAHARLIS